MFHLKYFQKLKNTVHNYQKQIWRKKSESMRLELLLLDDNFVTKLFMMMSMKLEFEISGIHDSILPESMVLVQIHVIYFTDSSCWDEKRQQ